MPHGADSDQGDDSQSRLDDHGAVADDLGVFLAGDLLAGGAGSDQRMEAGARAAGHGDEQSREQSAQVALAADGLGQSIGPAGDHGDLHMHIGAEDADDGQDHHAVEQEGGQIVTRLQQHPDGQQGSCGDVNCYEDDPSGTAHVDADLQAQPDNKYNADDTNNSCGTDLGVLPVHEEAEDKCNDDEQQGGHCGGGVGRHSAGGEEAVVYKVLRGGVEGGAGRDSLISAGIGFGKVGHAVLEGVDLSRAVVRHEGAGHDGGEGSDDQDKNQQREDHEQLLSLGAHAVADNFRYGQAAVADGSEQRAEVVHGAEEDAADDNPEQDRQPAEHCSLDRSVNGACAGYGREMVSHQNRGMGGDIVLAVVVRMGRCFTVGVHAPLFGQPAAIEYVT